METLNCVPNSERIKLNGTAIVYLYLYIYFQKDINIYFVQVRNCF